jgi:hypothetical protein
MAMDLFSIFTDPKVLFVILAIVALGVFVYYQWRKTSTDINELAHGQKKLQKQFAHGVITDEKINPLKIDNASNMSEETMDYEYEQQGQIPRQEQDTESEEPETDPETDNESSSDGEQPPQQQMGRIPQQKFIDNFSNLINEHHEHRVQGQTDGEFHAHYGVSVVPEAPDIDTIPGHEILGELRQMRDRDDIVIIQDNDYETDSEELIEFQDITEDMDDTDDDIETLKLMDHKKEQIVQEKIHHDIQRLDNENNQWERQMRACAAQQRKEQEQEKGKGKVVVSTPAAPAPAPKPVAVRTKTAQLHKKPISVKPKTTLIVTPKVTVKPTLKTSVPPQKIQPKIKNIGIKV